MIYFYDWELKITFIVIQDAANKYTRKMKFPIANIVLKSCNTLCIGPKTILTVFSQYFLRRMSIAGNKRRIAAGMRYASVSLLSLLFLKWF